MIELRAFEWSSDCNRCGDAVLTSLRLQQKGELSEEEEELSEEEGREKEELLEEEEKEKAELLEEDKKE